MLHKFDSRIALTLNADIVAEREERSAGDLIGLDPCGLGRTVPLLHVHGAVADDARGSRQVQRLVANLVRVLVQVRLRLESERPAWVTEPEIPTRPGFERAVAKH
jgi:hypothetical protein